MIKKPANTEIVPKGLRSSRSLTNISRALDEFRANRAKTARKFADLTREDAVRLSKAS